MESRREFFRKAGIAGGLGVGGALTLKREYVKPAIKLLEPGGAYAQSPAIVVMDAVWNPNPVLFPAAVGSLLTLMIDVPGASPPAIGQTFDVSVRVTNVVEGASAWGTSIAVTPPGSFPQGSSLTSAVMDNVGLASGGNHLTFSLNTATMLLNGVAIPATAGVPTVINAFNTAPALSGDAMMICLNVAADAGVTTGGNSYPAQALGAYCLSFQIP